MTFEDILRHVQEHVPEAVLDTDEKSLPTAMLVDAAHLVELMAFLKDDKSLYFDMLSCLTGIDNGEEAQTMEVAYNLYSIPHGHALMVRITVARDHPEVDSISSLFRTADWQEREIYDLLGIRFNAHKDLRRILMPNDWVGHPLRKDYREQEKYHGMYVIHEDIRNADKEENA